MKKSILFVLSIFITGSAYSSINLFLRSLPNQAVVNSIFVLDTWDYIIRPANYSLISSDAISSVYTPDQYGRKTFVIGGRNTVGLPIHWAVGLKNERSTDQYYKPGSGTSEFTNGEMHFRSSIGVNLSGLGVGFFGELLDASVIGKDTVSSNNYVLGEKINNQQDNRYRAGMNMGQSGNITWSLGVGYRKEGGNFSTTQAGTTTEGISPSLLALSVGSLRRPGKADYVDVSTFGSFRLTERGERLYWTGDFSYQLDAAIDVKEITGSNVKKATIDEDENYGRLYLGYSMAWPLSKTARFYFGPELGADYKHRTTKASNDANNPLANGKLGFNGAASQRLQEGQTSISAKLKLPIVFQLPVVENILILQAGWYPEVSLYSVTQREQTNSLANPIKTVDVQSIRFLQANVEKYGAGLTYTPVNRLRIHMLFTTLINDDPNIVATERFDMSRVSVGVDYIFEKD